MARSKNAASRRRRRFASTLALAVGVAIAPAVRAQPAADAVAALRAEIDALRRDSETRIAALEAKIRELEATTAARVPAAPPVRGGLNALNPEISLTGVLLGTATDSGRDDFELQEMELDLQSSLDPFSRTRWTLSAGPDGVEIEEGYVAYPSVRPGLGLTVGKQRQQFGPLNRQHLHALPQNGYPRVLEAFFGEDGLAQTGVSLEWLMPRGWASANELVVQLTDGESEAFGGESFEHLTGLVRLKSYWDLGPAAYFEWGLSAAAGGNGAGGETRVWGTDWTYHWQPPSRAQHRELTWRSEILLSQRDDPAGVRREAWGGYAYVEALLRRNASLGVRYDRVEDPLAPDHRTWAIVPYLTWWQSEFVRLRAELQHVEDELLDESENRFQLQLTWAAGPHKHETY